MRSIAHALAAVLLMSGPRPVASQTVTPQTVAPQTLAALAAAVPVEVAEVVTGGTWIDGQASGNFRTVTIQVPGVPEAVEIYLQWVGSRSPASPVEIISSVALREFNEQKLASASITLEGDVEGEARIVIAGQDGGARPVALLTYQASLPGVFQIVPSQPADKR